MHNEIKGYNGKEIFFLLSDNFFEPSGDRMVLSPVSAIHHPIMIHSQTKMELS